MKENLSKNHYINRDISWVDFNSRVLEEAGDKFNPVIERLKFIAIFSNNLDEFFMVRVAGIKQQLEAGEKSTDPSGLSAQEQLKKIREKLLPLLERQSTILHSEILPELRSKGVMILSPAEWTPSDRREIKNIFERQIFPALTPIAFDPSHPFPVLTTGCIEIAVKMKHFSTGKIVRAFVEVPTVLPRFIPIVGSVNKEAKTYVLLEDVIYNNIELLFNKCEILEILVFRITRDMDFTVEEEGAADLLVNIRKELLKRRKREPVRLELLKGTEGETQKWLIKKLGFSPEDIYYLEKPLHLANFFQLVAKESRPDLTEEQWTPVANPLIKESESLFSTIRQHGEIPIHLPFQSFDPIVRLIEEAANDPNVLAIKQTLYRVSGDSPVIKALIMAAQNKKQVTAIVELKARFDEEHNIHWAIELEEAGAHVIYGIAGLKIHCKALLIIRREEGIIRRYVHLSTGNYNEKTARIYTDAGIFSDDPELCSDIAALFNVMTGYSAKPEMWNKIAVAPFDLHEKFISLIDREARLSTKHSPGRIIAKMNSLVHPNVIAHLYKAAEAGVKIDLIVRGICCLKPGIGTKNISVTSIVDRFLEHTRIYYFQNAGNPEYYMASADWMPRNLHKRIEVLFPVQSETTKKQLWKILELELADKFKSRKLDSNGIYSEHGSAKFAETRSQRKIYELFLANSKKNETKPEKQLMILRQK